MANEVHKDDIVLPGDSHVTAMEAIKDEFGLRASDTTTLGLLKVTFAAVDCQKIRMQRRFLVVPRTWDCPWAKEEDQKSAMIARHRDAGADDQRP